MASRLFEYLSARPAWFWPAAIAGVALVAICLTLDPAGDHPGGFDGPGLTLDEPFNVGQGVAMVDRLLSGDWAGFRAADAQLPDHPPLGRLWIGLCHELALIVWPPVSLAAPYSVACARTAPALASAATVLMVGWCAGRWWGRLAGAIASLSLLLMPRMFGHAHLAALETCINLAYAAVVCWLADHWLLPAEPARAAQRDTSGALRPVPTTAATLVGGVFLGLALLTKVQAILLPIPVCLWAFFIWRRRAIGPLILFGITGFVVFFVGWPWLWSAPIDHLRAYLGRTTDRAVVQVWYFGRAVTDRDVPWHYPWVLFLTTVPIGSHVLGVVGLFGRSEPTRCTPRKLLIVACAAFPLMLFSLPGVPVYDGERLFSVVFPLWALLIGAGAEVVRAWVARHVSARWVSPAIGLLIAAQGYSLYALAPCWLSYYNVAVGGLSGAARLGLSVTYWGDSLTRTFLNEAAARVGPNGHIAAQPVLYSLQWNEVLLQSPALVRQEVEFQTPDAQEPAWRLAFLRKEYLPAELRDRIPDDQIVAAVRREGVLLAVLYRAR